MWLLMKTAWRNLFRQRRRTAITASAMALSLAMAIPFYGLILGIREQVVQAICGMELGHLQVHNTAYADGRALAATLREPDGLLKAVRATPGVKGATARVHGYGLVSNDRPLALRMDPNRQIVHPKGRLPGERASDVCAIAPAVERVDQLALKVG